MRAYSGDWLWDEERDLPHKDEAGWSRRQRMERHSAARDAKEAGTTRCSKG